jgi:iron complex transport system substrate-binding protein
MRIVSLLPSATEILYALGLGDSVVGVTHECDFPPEAAQKPALIKPRVDPHAPQAEIDRQVRELVSRGESIYAVDADLLESLKPDLILTQDLCHVCAASPDDLATALTGFQHAPRVLPLAPHSLDDVWHDIERVGDTTGTTSKAETLVANLKCRIAHVESAVSRAASRPRVLCLEWLDPYYVAGHWVPEMVARAGGDDVLGRQHETSFKVTSEEIAGANAETIIVMLCGYNAAKNAAEFSTLRVPESWQQLPAFQEGRIFAMDANSYSSRPGPRLADGLEMFAHFFHPELFSEKLPSGAYLRVGARKQCPYSGLDASGRKSSF